MVIPVSFQQVSHCCSDAATQVAKELGVPVDAVAWSLDWAIDLGKQMALPVGSTDCIIVHLVGTIQTDRGGRRRRYRRITQVPELVLDRWIPERQIARLVQEHQGHPSFLLQTPQRLLPVFFGASWTDKSDQMFVLGQSITGEEVYVIDLPHSRARIVWLSGTLIGRACATPPNQMFRYRHCSFTRLNDVVVRDLLTGRVFVQSL